MRYCRGLLPPRRLVGLRLRSYVSLSRLPTPPDDFGPDVSGIRLGIWGNDQFGNCVECTQQAAELVFAATSGAPLPSFSAQTAEALYSAEAGFNPANPSTDQGTDMATAAAYWRATGLKDASGRVLAISDYVYVDKGDVDVLVAGAFVFKFALAGATVSDAQQTQFDEGKPWAGPLTTDPGGHCFGIMGLKSGVPYGPTWARWDQEYEESFLADEGMGSLVPLAPAALAANKELPGLDYEALVADLAALRQGAA